MTPVGETLSGLAHSVSDFFERGALSVGLDLLDIFLVAAVVYWGLLLLKGTRAMQMAFGLLFVFLAYMVSKSLGLITIWSLLDTLVTYVVLVVVIIFQADIRRALMRVGSQQFFRGQRTARETGVIEEVIKAAQELAQKRIGALVVFERSADLSEFIESGTTLDANVTKELLYTIFIPSFENPMHDGALIIRDGRVWQAGAFLPLAGTAGRDRTLGARHRAALGISEETDAVVVVVSEEKGAISLCFGGNIVRGLDGSALRDALFGLFYRKPDAKKDTKKKKKKKPEERLSVLPEQPEEREPSGELASTRAEDSVS